MTQSVADLCRERQLTIEQFAKLTGLAEDRVTAIILGRWTPSPSERSAVSDALQVAVSDITWGHLTPIQHIYGHGPG